MPDSAQDKSEKATPKRREDARKKGNVAKSPELPSAAVLLAGIGTLAFTSSIFYKQLTYLMSHAFSQAGYIQIGNGAGYGFFLEIVTGMAKVVAPVMAVVFVVALLANFAQIGALVTMEPLKPNISKLNPLKGLKNMFSLKTVFNTVKNVLKLVAIAYVAYWTVRGEMENLVLLVDMPVIQILGYIMKVAFNIFIRCTVLILFLAFMDYVYQKWEYEKGLRMSKQEVKDEFKQREGDPIVKARIRTIQRKMAQQRMLDDVPEADVIVTNPTHLAVALKYISGEMEAPKIVAKGAGFMAEKIKQIAKAYEIPIVENKPLAQALYRVEIGQFVPVELYKAVAEVLAYVYGLKNARTAAG